MQEQAQQSTQNDNIYNQSHSQKNVTIQKVDKLITPFDLEHSILRPQVDPLVGDIVTRLLQKIKWKLKDADVSKGKGAVDAYADEDRQAVQSQSYDQWNEALAKKFAVMYKKYLKFRQGFMKHENEEEITKVLEDDQGSEGEDQEGSPCKDKNKEEEEKKEDGQEDDDKPKDKEAKDEAIRDAKYRGDYPVSHSLTRHLL